MEKEKNKIIKLIENNKIWIMIFIALIVFFEILENIFNNEIWEFDAQIYNLVSHIISQPVTDILKIITNLGGAVGIITITVILIIFLKNIKYKKYILINLGIITILNQALKFIIQRPRPTEYRIIEQGGYSFPSRTFDGKYGILWIFNILNK